MNLIRICAELFRTLSVWLTDARCPHYFINNCNLLDSYCGLEEFASHLMLIDETWLAMWFVNNYIRKCSELCPDNVSCLFSDVSTSMKLQKAVSAVVDWRLATVLRDKCKMFNLSELLISHTVSEDDLTIRSYYYWTRGLSKIDSLLIIYFNAMACLKVAYKISRNGFSDELIDVLATMSGLSISTRRHINQRSSELSLVKATKLMKVVAIKSNGAVQLIGIKLSRAYLHRALRCNDSESDSIKCLANVYLAALYYTTGQYHTALDYCTQVMRSQDHSQCSSHVVQGELLPKIDDDIDSALGLAVFYQHIRRAALNHQQTQHVAVFSTEMFAHYLHNRCLSHSVTQTSTNAELCRFEKYVINTYMLITDVLALKSVFHKFPCRPTTLSNSRQETINSSELNLLELAELLQKSSVEHYTAYRQLRALQIRSVDTAVTTDYEALYAYKRGDYQRCLLLSTQNVHKLLNASVLSNVFINTFPMFIQMFDDEIVSLIALTLIVDPKCANVNVGISPFTLSLYLMTKCQLKLHHSVISLAQIIDCIEIAQSGYPDNYILDHLTLKMIQRTILNCKTTVQASLELSQFLADRT